MKQIQLNFRLFFSLIAIFYIDNITAQTDTWIETNTGIIDSVGQSFETRAILTLNDNKMFTFLKWHSAGEEKAGVYQYNVDSLKWNRIAPRLNKYGYSVLVSSGTRIFGVPGGNSHTFFELDIKNNQWIELITVPDVGIDFGRGVDALENKIYIHCKANENVIADFPDYNFSENETFVMQVNADEGSFTLLRNPNNPLIIPARGGNPQNPIALKNGKVYTYATWDYKAKDGYGGIYQWDGTNWETATLGLNVINITGSDFGPIGPIYTDSQHSKLFVRTEQGFYEKTDEGWIKYFYRTPSRFFISPDYLFINNNNGSFSRINQAVKKYFPNNGLSCVSGVNYFMTPDNGNTFFAQIEVKTDVHGNCSDEIDDKKKIGIYRYRPDYEKNGTVLNLHIDIGTYLGGGGQNKTAETVITSTGKILIAGIFNDNMGGNEILLFDANSTSKGKIYALSAGASKIEKTIILGQKVNDMDINADNEIAVIGDFGVAVLNSDYTVKWSTKDSTINKSRIAIADNGYVVALLKSDSNGGGVVKLYSDDGTVIHRNTKNDINGTHINNVEISSAEAHNKYYLTGFAQVSGNLQVAYIRAYGLNQSTDRLWKTWSFGAGEVDLSTTGADTRGYHIKATNDKLYVACETAGGGPGGFTVLAYNGKNLTDKIADKGNDFYTDGTNANGACHITFLGRINPTDGTVEQGRFFHGRLSNGKTNTHRVEDGDLEIDNAGNVYLTGVAAAQIQDRDVFNVNGLLTGEYAGSDQYILMSNSDFSKRIMWGVFSKNKGGGKETRIAVNNNKVAYIATSTQGTLITTDNAFKDEPYNTLQDQNKLDSTDVYFALWSKEVWNTANSDDIQRPFIRADACFRADDLPCRTEDIIGKSKLDLITPFNMITPNGDGRNDTWYITDIQLLKEGTYTIRIFNQAGLILYQTNEAYKQDWDATYNGKPLPAGVYYYSIIIDGQEKTKMGYITVLY